MVEKTILNRARKARTRTLLLESAKKLFTNPGYEQTKIVNITGEAGMSVGAFYKHFKNKDEVFFEIAKEGNNNLRERIASFRSKWSASPLPFNESLKDILDTVFDFFDEYPFFIPVFATGAHSGVPAIKQAYSLIMEDVTEALLAYASVGVQTKAVRDLDPDISITAGVGIISAIASMYARGEAPREKLVDTLTEFIGHGILLEDSTD